MNKGTRGEWRFTSEVVHFGGFVECARKFGRSPNLPEEIKAMSDAKGARAIDLTRVSSSVQSSEVLKLAVVKNVKA
jgi:hypothetical protein